MPGFWGERRGTINNRQQWVKHRFQRTKAPILLVRTDAIERPTGATWAQQGRNRGPEPGSRPPHLSTARRPARLATTRPTLILLELTRAFVVSEAPFAHQTTRSMPVLAPYIDVLLSLAVIGLAMVLMVWPAIMVTLIRFFPDRVRTPALTAAIAMCALGTFGYYQTLPQGAGAGLQWREAIVAETPNWDGLIADKHWAPAFGLDDIEFRGPPADDFGGFLHGNVRAVAAADRWMLRHRIVGPLLDAQTNEQPRQPTVEVLSVMGRQLRTVAYGLVWTPMLSAYSRVAPFIWGLFVASLWLLARRRGATQSLEGTRSSELAAAWPLPWMGVAAALLVVLAIPFKFAAPTMTMDALVPELANAAEVPDSPNPDPLWDQAEAVTPEREPDPAPPDDDDFEELPPLVDGDGLPDEDADPELVDASAGDAEDQSPPLPVSDPSADEAWPETVRVDSVIGVTRIRSDPDLFGTTIVARAYNNARLDIRGEMVCGPDYGLWVPVRVAFDSHEEADPDHRGVEGWAEVQDLEPHRYACCGERLYDCIPWPEWDPESYPEVEPTIRNAMVESSTIVRSEPGSFPDRNNRNYRLRAGHMVEIDREVCTPTGHRWAHITTQREMDDGSFRQGTGWAFRPSLSPNSNGCCLGRTGADPDCMDGAEAFFETP